MPVYEYECSKCEKVFEIQQRIADDPITVCSVCGGEVRKLISMSSFQLKGGGWHTDGYSGPSNGKGAQSAPSPASSTEAATPPSCPAGGACSHCPAAT